MNTLRDTDPSWRYVANSYASTCSTSDLLNCYAIMRHSFLADIYYAKNLKGCLIEIIEYNQLFAGTPMTKTCFYTEMIFIEPSVYSVVCVMS